MKSRTNPLQSNEAIPTNSHQSMPKTEITRSMTNEKLLIPAAEAAKMLSVGRSTFWNKVRLNQFPQPIRIAGLTRWRVSDIEKFVAESR